MQPALIPALTARAAQRLAKMSCRHHMNGNARSSLSERGEQQSRREPSSHLTSGEEKRKELRSHR